MKCLILAAGYATRLYPLTENFPKPLLNVAGKSIIDWLIDDVCTAKKVDEFIIVSNHKFVNFFYEWKETKKIGEKITIIDDETTSNDTRLGAVADIDMAIKKLKIDDDLIVVAGDNVLDFSLVSFINYFKNKNATCVMKYYEDDLNKIKRSASIKVDEDNKVIEMLEKPDAPNSHYCCPPFYIYDRHDIPMVSEAIKNGCNTDAPGSFISYLCKKSNVYAYQMPGKRYDIGNIDSYTHINEIYKGIVH